MRSMLACGFFRTVLKESLRYVHPNQDRIIAPATRQIHPPTPATTTKRYGRFLKIEFSFTSDRVCFLSQSKIIEYAPPAQFFSLAEAHSAVFASGAQGDVKRALTSYDEYHRPTAAITS